MGSDDVTPDRAEVDLFAAAPDGIVIVDKQGVIRFANPAAAKLFTRSPEALIGSELGSPLVAGETTEMEIVRRGGGELVYAELSSVLEKNGLERIDALGAPFDPNEHEAVMQEPSDKHPAMTVTQTFQQGYKLGDRVLRPAKVKVSK